MNFEFSMMPSVYYLCLLVIAFLLSFVFAHPLKSLAERTGFLDFPGQSHKSHQVPIPYLGGLSIVLSLLILTIVMPWVIGQNNQVARIALITIGPGLMISIIGLIDDKLNLQVKTRLICQSLSALLASLLLANRGYLVDISNSEIINLSLSVLGIVSVTNFFNFVDNIDGGSTGLTIITSFFLFLLCFFSGQIAVASLALCLMGANLGFLNWNFPKARMYLGDSGSLFNGFVLAVLYLQYDSNRVGSPALVFTSIFIFAVPLLDAIVAVSDRWRSKRPLTIGGKDHLAHRLLRMGFSKQNTVLLLWFVSFIFGLAALCIQIGPKIVVIPTIFTGGIILFLVGIFISERKFIK